MKTISTNLAHGGVQGVYSHDSETTRCKMTFAVYEPPQAKTEKTPVLWYLSGLTCSHANVMEKGEYRRAAAQHGVTIICPDTSPRNTEGGEEVPDEDNWQFGSGAGFYLDATEAPYDRHYNMYSYITRELPELIAGNFNVDMARQGIFGHSMGGHGALTIALKNPDRFKSCSAFAPICEPSKSEWSAGAFRKYLGKDESKWRDYDASLLIEDGKRFSGFLADQGTADSFLEEGLRPKVLEAACAKAGIPLQLRMREGYDHSYYFISSFMEDHIRWHAERL